MLRHSFHRLPALLLVSVVAGCKPIGELSDRLFDSRAPRQRYLDGLARAGLAATAMFRDWSRAGELALKDAPLVKSPHLEEVSLPPAEPAAIGLRVTLRRGQQVRFEVVLPGDSVTLVFLEAWRLSDQADSIVKDVAHAKSGERSLAFDADADAEYLFRAQPELLRGGRFSVSLVVAPTLGFPVPGRGENDIKSRWGASRDGGRRRHTGLDIFARRGTPVLAAARGRVIEVGENELGGNVVWLRDERGNTHYYAHLSAQLVSYGDLVELGDTLGLVGNTGNARTTPPHLHFGIYRRGEGPVDPFWFIHRPAGQVQRVTADTTLLGNFARVPARKVVLRRSPSNDADTLVTLAPEVPIRVLSATGSWLRVRASDGVTGFLPARLTRRDPAQGAMMAQAEGTGVVTGSDQP